MSVEESIPYQNSLSLWFPTWFSFSSAHCSLKSIQSFPLEEPKGSEGSKKVRKVMASACWSKSTTGGAGNGSRRTNEGQMEGHHCTTPSYSLWILLFITRVAVCDSLFVPNNITMVTRCKIIYYQSPNNNVFNYVIYFIYDFFLVFL